jgi:hypothetical protein
VPQDTAGEAGDAFKQGQAQTYTRTQTKLLWLVRIGWLTTGGIVETRGGPRALESAQAGDKGQAMKVLTMRGRKGGAMGGFAALEGIGHSFWVVSRQCAVSTAMPQQDRAKEEGRARRQ